MLLRCRLGRRTGGQPVARLPQQRVGRGRVPVRPQLDGGQQQHVRRRPTLHGRKVHSRGDPAPHLLQSAQRREGPDLGGEDLRIVGKPAQTFERGLQLAAMVAHQV